MFDRYLLSAEIHRAGYTQAEVAQKIGIFPSTMSKRMNTGNWKADEMYKLVELLQIEHPERIFFADKVTQNVTTKGDT